MPSKRPRTLIDQYPYSKRERIEGNFILPRGSSYPASKPGIDYLYDLLPRNVVDMIGEYVGDTNPASYKPYLLNGRSWQNFIGPINYRNQRNWAGRYEDREDRWESYHYANAGVPPSSDSPSLRMPMVSRRRYYHSFKNMYG